MCHNTTDWTSTAMPAGHMPNPSNLSCLTCHTKSPSDYTPATLAANSVLHTGITGNCGLCHGNNVAALTWANNFTPKDALLSPSTFRISPARTAVPATPRAPTRSAPSDP